MKKVKSYNEKENPLSSFKAWAEFCKKHNVSLPQAAVYYLKQYKKYTDESIDAALRSFVNTWKFLYKKMPVRKFTTASGLITGIGPDLLKATKEAGIIYMAAIATTAMEATSSGMIPIVAAFTCGAAGTFPGILYDLLNANNVSFEEIKEVLLVAFAVGVIAKTISSISGALGMCSAETGNSAAAAAAARIWHYTKDPVKTFKVVEVIISRMQGIPCDPIAGGLVEVPCGTRNGNATIIALMTCNEIINSSNITEAWPDKELRLQKKIGDAAPDSLKETSLGATAATPGAMAYYNAFVKGKIPADLHKIIKPLN